MITSLLFNKENLTRKISINNEKPFLKVLSVFVPNIKQGEKDIRAKASNVLLSYTIQSGGRQASQVIFHDLGQENYQRGNGHFQIENILFDNNFSDYKEIEFKCEINRDDDFEMRVFYETIDLYIPLHEAFLEFKNHLETNSNVKILFSAPFGQGKTTFLNYFFEENKNQYEVFKLYPVNYSVSHNEDIFKYIKCELLFQLLGKDVEFDKNDFSYLDTAPEFFKENVQHFLAPLLFLLPKIGRSAHSIYEKYYELAKKYFEYHDEIEGDDKKKAIQFIKSLYKEEGTVYEDNFYTQLIRQLLEQYKNKIQKKMVLLIDDLDRMDPDHIFRILNVFAAHFDSQEYNGGSANKFGLDKIIIVCDHSNLREIFAHRYGSKTSFDGYIDKYFSNEPFHHKVINPETFIHKINQGRIERLQMELFVFIITDMLNTGSITVREFDKLSKQDLALINFGLPSISRGTITTTKGETISKYKNIIFPFFPILYYLSKLSDIDSVIGKLQRTSDLINYDYNRKRKFNFNQLTPVGFVPMVYDAFSKIEIYTYVFKNVEYSFSIMEDRTSSLGFKHYSIKNLQSKNGSEPIFNEKDFYDILILNAQRYKKLGGMGE